MSVTPTNPQAPPVQEPTPPQVQAPPSVPEPVQEAEQKVVDRVPENLQESAQQVADAFNAFEQEEVTKAEANVSQQEADAAAKEPEIEAAAEAAKVGNVEGVLMHGSGVVKEVKAGYKTTEFWVTMAGVVLTQLGTLHLPGKYGDTITTAALLGSYALSRGLAKR